MEVFEGDSSSRDARQAVEEAAQSWPQSDSPCIIFAMHSVFQNAQTLAEALAERFSDSLIVGVSTANVWTTKKHLESSLVLLAVCSSNIRWSVAVAENLHEFDKDKAGLLRDDLLAQLKIKPHQLRRSRNFCLSFFDGLCQCEEHVVSEVNRILSPTVLLGGSASDDLKFKNTYVMANGRAYQNAAVFVLADCDLPFTTIKHQHFIPGDTHLVVTKVDDSGRRILHLDGMPAAQRYASLTGVSVEQLNPEHFSLHPLMYQFAGEGFIRSIAQVSEDDLIVYTPVEEGMLLNLCKQQALKDSFTIFIDEHKKHLGAISLMFGFNCVLCSLEAEALGIKEELREHLAGAANHLLVFDSYGEQWQGLHINQTFVALILGESL